MTESLFSEPIEQAAIADRVRDGVPAIHNQGSGFDGEPRTCYEQISAFKGKAESIRRPGEDHLIACPGNLKGLRHPDN